MRYFFHRDDRCLNLEEKLIGFGDAFKKPMGPCIVSPRGGIPRVIEGNRGSLYEAQEAAIGYGWLCVKRDFPAITCLRNMTNFTGKCYSLGILKVISPGNHPF